VGALHDGNFQPAAVLFDKLGHRVGRSTYRTPGDILQDSWQAAGLPDDALTFAALHGADPVFPSSFRIGAAAQSTIAAAALAACEVAHQRGTARQRVTVDMAQAAIECTGWFSIDGRVPVVWDAFSGL
jgi:hypothetical protein